MTTQTEALNIAIDYMNERLEDHDFKYKRHPATEAERINILADIETIKEALAQPEQEPVAHFGSAYVNENGVHITTVLGPVAIPQDAKLYTTPPQRTWVGLTNEEFIYFCSYVRADVLSEIEEKLKELNT